MQIIPHYGAVSNNKNKHKISVRKENVMVTPRGCDSAKVISVIVTRALKGSGTENDPVREVIQYWDFDGNLLAEHDSVNERF